MRISFFILLSVLLSCTNQTVEQSAPPHFYSTQRDSTLHYYLLGWHQILNQGNYGPAEVSYRKALSFDSDFLLGQSVLARLTEDLEERQGFYDQIQPQADQVENEEGDLLAVFLSLMRYTLLREKDPEAAAAWRPELLANAQDLLCGVRRKHPNIDYIESECVEFIHATQGAAAALDSMALFRKDRVISNPFLDGYQAVLLAELKQYEEALKLAESLARTDQGQAIPRPDVIMAHVYFAWGKLQEAKMHADRAVEMDPRNLEASRLQSSILAALSQQEN